MMGTKNHNLKSLQKFSFQWKTHWKSEFRTCADFSHK